MNLWVKRTGQLAMAVALFFFSCKDEISLLGYPNPNSKFNVHYAEISLESDVYTLDSVSTLNLSGQLNRVMVGAYSDPAFGRIETTGITQIYPTRIDTSKVFANSAQVDSVALQLRFDYYAYGSEGSTPQSFTIHEVLERYDTGNVAFLGKTRVLYNSTPLGGNSYSVSASTFKSQFAEPNNEKDTAIINITLDRAYGERLLELAKLDTAYNDFYNKIYGLAVVPNTTNDKIVGFDINNGLDPGSILSKVIVYYHTSKDTTTLNFGFGGARFTQIGADRFGTPELSGLLPNMGAPDTYYDTIAPATNRYLQCGTGVVTRIDFGKFFEFADAIDRMIINSCELVISDIESTTQFAPIDNFAMIALRDDNRFLKTELDTTKEGDVVLSERQVAEITYYNGTISNSQGFITAISDDSNPANLIRSDKSYNTYITLLTQQLYIKPADRRYRYFGLLPANPSNGKTVNRTIFNKNNLKLKIYYTIPTVAQ